MILVKGTKGGEAIKRAISACIDSIQGIWNSKYQGSLPVISDTQLLQQGFDDNVNYVLFGNQFSNIAVAQVEDSPIQVFENGIVFRNGTIEAQTISYNLIYPNTRAENSYLVLVGATNDELIAVPKNDLSIQQHYDFVFWNPLDTLIQPMQGYFDDKWQ